MRRRIPALFLGLFLFLPASAGAAATTDLEGAKTFIDSLADRAIDALTDNGVPRVERIRRFRAILDRDFDITTIGRWVLGRYWRSATQTERSEYFELFERLIVANYVDRFSRYSGETLEVLRAQAKGKNDVIVSTRMIRPTGGEPVDVAWRVRMGDNGYRIVDVIVEGISMGQTQRSEFASVIRKNGGRVEGLLKELRQISLEP